jgi:hypothetical protein
VERHDYYATFGCREVQSRGGGGVALPMRSSSLTISSAALLDVSDATVDLESITGKSDLPFWEEYSRGIYHAARR